MKSPWPESYISWDDGSCHGLGSYHGRAAITAGQLSRPGSYHGKSSGSSLGKMCFFFRFMSPSTQALDDGAGKMMVVLYRSQGD